MALQGATPETERHLLRHSLTKGIQGQGVQGHPMPGSQHDLRSRLSEHRRNGRRLGDRPKECLPAMGCKEGGIGEKKLPGARKGFGEFFLPGPVFLFPKPLAEEGRPRHAGNLRRRPLLWMGWPGAAAFGQATIVGTRNAPSPFGESWRGNGAGVRLSRRFPRISCARRLPGRGWSLSPPGDHP